ncbi:PREDICTED: poly(A)-specific ribonuclease PARN isoform X1 [Nicotiana attenuata]|uniref:Poly(A)-specific ribonuclease parn n=2 Tax=Nicotiana attenuata TaxID=49451 RepID=A0A1J6IS55_NICAT|nr:PREDICTED: poly(A)-specific ribonuclease PARN isoform X1 [Nicotiana attenuata]OIT00543.1 poly(a)-specific ribonuclease parn [Nicotiana attenuata]
MKKQCMLKPLSTILIQISHAPITSFTTHRRALSSSSSSSFALKNVTKSNFESALKDLRGLVRDADFVAVDLEMTGVTSAPWRDSFEFDRYDIRYLKVKDSAEKFAVVQFGICPFRWDSHKQSFLAHPHNFYIFPRQEIPGSNQSYEFLCQTASLDFLAKYQFDFNVCVREGVSYLSRSQEEEAVERINSTFMDESSDSVYGLREDAEFPLVRMADVLFAERMKNTIREWHASLLSKGSSSSEIKQMSTDPNQRFQMVFFKTRPALALSGFTSRQLRVIKAVTKKHFKDLAFIRVAGEATSPQQLIVYTDSNDDKDLLMKEVKEGLRKEAEIKVKSAVGFRHVIDLLSSERKLIVGHNCFLDMAHIYSKFIGPLPLTAEDYVSSIQKYFPCIIDTKVLLNANGVFQQSVNKSSTSLSRAFVSICPQIALGVKTSGLADRPCVEVEVQVDEKRSLNWNSGAKHEAGYDAFMTGCIFAQACNHLGIDFTLHVLAGGLPKETKLQNYINRLYLSWVTGDIIDLSTGKCTTDTSASSNLKSRYQEISFPSIVLLWGLPSKLKAREIKACIVKVFGPNSISSVYHLDESAVFIQFSKPELVSKFLEIKETLSRNSDPISVLHPLSDILNADCTHAANYDVYQQICSSPISKKLFADQAEAVGIKHKTVSSRAEGKKKGNQVFGKENEVRLFDEKVDDMMSSSYGYSETDRSADSSYLDEALVSK